MDDGDDDGNDKQKHENQRILSLPNIKLNTAQSSSLYCMRLRLRNATTMNIEQEQHTTYRYETTNENKKK